MCDAHGNPLKFILSPGQTHDSVLACDLIDDYKDTALLADKAYNSQEIDEKALSQNIEIVIQSKKNSKTPRTIDEFKYKSRHLIENFFQRLKVYRRISTRYDKLDKNFLGFVYLGASFKWLH